MKYEIHYVLYNCENIIRFRGLSQYWACRNALCYELVWMG